MVVINSKEVLEFSDRLFCDECAEEMKFTGMALASYPMRFPHICPKCGKRVTKTDPRF